MSWPFSPAPAWTRSNFLIASVFGSDKNVKVKPESSRSFFEISGASTLMATGLMPSSLNFAKLFCIPRNSERHAGHQYPR